MNIAIPTYKDEVAPSFDYCSLISLFAIEEKKVLVKNDCKCFESSIYNRVHELIKLETNIVICNGIKAPSIRLLQSNQIHVIFGISGQVENVIYQYLQKKLNTKTEDIDQIALEKKNELKDLKEWSKNYFLNLGFKLITQEMKNSKFPIDFVAIKTCPLCDKKIKIAICCGNHLYRKDEEIKEFVRSVGDEYDAKVYVHPAFPAIEQLCEKHKVELIDAGKNILENKSEIVKKFYSHKSLVR